MCSPFGCYSPLAARGYALGGRARNYQRELGLDSPAAAEAAALEVLQVFFEVFGYRRQWQLDLVRHRGERADHDLDVRVVNYGKPDPALERLAAEFA